MNGNNDAEGMVLRYLEDPRPDLKDLIIIRYTGLVERVARRFAGIESVDDLIQVGYIGLLNALSKFDQNAGVRFNTYATHLVAGEIKHYLRDRAQTIRHPAWLQELRHKVNRAATMLQARDGQAPTERQIAEELGVSESAVREVYATQEMLKVSSLDVGASDDDDSESEVDRLDGAAFCPEQLSVEDRVVLEEAMQQLRDLEREVLVLFHFDSLNQTEIAHKLGISCNYVSHILRQSLAKLRRILTSEEREDEMLRRGQSDAEVSSTDPETGVYNEAYFRARLTEELHRASASSGVLSIVLVDFVGLQRLRSFYGEASVHDFLADAADFLRRCVRRLDIVCRYGEHGFGIILPTTGASVTVVRQRVAHKFDGWLVGRMAPSGPIRVRLGHAVYPEDAENLNKMLEIARPRDEFAVESADGEENVPRAA